jgi:hypothetical protein
MDKTIQTLRYLSKSLTFMAVIAFISVLACMAVSDLVFFLTDHSNVVRIVDPLMEPFEFTAAIFSLLTGLVLLIPEFKVALANGVSRKTFMLANLPAAALFAAALSSFTLVVMLLHTLFWPSNLISTQIYPSASWAWTLFLQFVLYFLIIIAGWFIVLAYYRSSLLLKWAISLTPFALFGLLKVANAWTGGLIFEKILAYLLWSVQLERVPFFMLAYAAILCGAVYLLIRRAPLKN